MQGLNALKPELVWKYFEDILAIARPSKKEDKIIRYIKEFAEKHKLNGECKMHMAVPGQQEKMPNKIRKPTRAELLELAGLAD